MTFEDDFVRFVIIGKGSTDKTCRALGISWPPPETLECAGVTFDLYRKSEITDEQRESLTCVVRGAEYHAHVECENCVPN